MRRCLSCPKGKPQPDSALGSRFKVFADYEAYIKCQGQVDQLFMVRNTHCWGGKMGLTGMSVLQWSPPYAHCSMWVPCKAAGQGRAG